MRWATVKFADGATQRVVLKVGKGGQHARLYGLAREGCFYNSWEQLVAVSEDPAQAKVLLASLMPGEGDVWMSCRPALGHATNPH
jgi:hypothetical protein